MNQNSPERNRNVRIRQENGLQKKKVILKCPRCKQTFVKDVVIEKAVEGETYKTKCPYCGQNRRCTVEGDAS